MKTINLFMLVCIFMFFTSIATEQAHTNNQNALKSEPVTNSHSTATEKTVESHTDVKSQDINAQYLPVIKEHSLISPFINGYWSDGIPHWDFYDSAVVTSNYIRLTPDVPSTYGSIWNTNRMENHAMCDEEYGQMLQLNPQVERSGYEFQITFRIWSQRTYGADGMGLFFTDEIPEQKNGPLMGHPAEFTGIAIIFDTFDNNHNGDGPTVRLLQGNIKKYAYNIGNNQSLFTKPRGVTGHEHTKIIKSPYLDSHHEWNKENDFDEVNIGKCKYQLRDSVDKNEMRFTTVFIQITPHSKLNLYLQHGYYKNEKFIEKDQVKCMENIPVTLPEHYHIGFTADTGSVTDYHDLYTVLTAPLVFKSHSHNTQRSTSFPVFNHGQENTLKSIWRLKANDELKRETTLEKTKDENIKGYDSESMLDYFLNREKRNTIIKELESDPIYQEANSNIQELMKHVNHTQSNTKQG